MLRNISIPAFAAAGAFFLCLMLLAPHAEASTYKVKSGDTPSGIAKKYGVGVKALLKANKLDPKKMRVGQVLTIPDGKAGSKKASPASSGATYKVRKGDTPSTIADRLGVSTKALMRANPKLNPRKMRVGQVLHVPGKGGTKKAASPKKTPKKKASGTYKIRRGDTLGKIAAKYGLSVSALRAANKGINPNKLYVGKKITIPGQAAEAAPKKSAPVKSAPVETGAVEETAQKKAPEKDAGPTKHETAAKQAKKDKKATPMDADAYFERGNELGKQNKYQQAIESFDKAIAANPDRADYYASRGHAFYYMKLYTRAVEDYTRALARNPKFSLVYSMRGLSNTRNGDYRNALADYNKAIELSPKEADYYKGRGYTYFHLKQYGPMCDDYQKSCDLGDCEFLEDAKKSKLCPAGG